MALVTSFERKPQSEGQLQRTQVIGHYKVFSGHEKRIFQIDTHGSAEREIPGKVSQTLQFSEDSAHALWLLLDKEFGFSKR
jgi:hypothetical protein